MRYQTEAVGETTWLLGELPSGGAVTITLYKLSDSSTPALDSNSCTEIGATGIYKWATTNITTPETTKTEYLYAMTDGTLNYFGKIVVGGYADKINANISTRSSHAAADIWSVGTRTLTDKAGFALSAAGITAIWEKNISAFSGAGYAGTYVKTLYDDWINAGRLDAILDTIAADVVNLDGDAMRGTDSANTTTPPTVDAIADQVWDEVLTGATHNLATSAGRRLRQAADVMIVREETCQAGGGNDEIIFDTGASAVDEFYINDLVVLTSGTGVGQQRHIDSYVGSSKTATVNRNWTTNPDATTGFVIKADSTKHVHGFETEAKAEIRDAILSDATKFAGANIDAKISSRSVPGDLKCGGGGGGGGTFIERPAIWKLEEKLKLIEDIKKMYKMINELGSLQLAGLQNVKKNIEDFKNSLIKLIKEEVTLLISLKVAISKQPQTKSSDAFADSVNQIIAKWDSVQKSILKPSDLSSLDNKLDDITKIMAKTLSNKDLEKLIHAE